MVQISLGKLKANKKNGDEIIFDLLNINNHSINDVILEVQMNKKKNVSPPKVWG